MCLCCIHFQTSCQVFPLLANVTILYWKIHICLLIGLKTSSENILQCRNQVQFLLVIYPLYPPTQKSRLWYEKSVKIEKVTKIAITTYILTNGIIFWSDQAGSNEYYRWRNWGDGIYRRPSKIRRIWLLQSV